MEDAIFTKHWNTVSTDAKTLRKLYTYFTKETGASICCDNVLKELFLKEKRKRKTMNTQKKLPSLSNYRLKEGTLLYLSSHSLHVTNANLTDEYAVELLKDSRNAKHFEIIPDLTESKEEAKDKDVLEIVPGEPETTQAPVSTQGKYQGKKSGKRNGKN